MNREINRPRSGRGDRIRVLQHMLRGIGFGDIEENGIYDERTRAAVQRFREENRLGVGETVDVRVWGEIRTRYMESRQETARPISPFMAGREVLPGERSDLVLLLQILLNTLRLRYDSYGHVPMSGVMDAETEAAVRAIRRANLLGDSGTVDTAFWNRIALEYDAAVREES